MEENGPKSAKSSEEEVANKFEIDTLITYALESPLKTGPVKKMKSSSLCIISLGADGVRSLYTFQEDANPRSRTDSTSK